MKTYVCSKFLFVLNNKTSTIFNRPLKHHKFMNSELAVYYYNMPRREKHSHYNNKSKHFNKTTLTLFRIAKPKKQIISHKDN